MKIGGSLYIFLQQQSTAVPHIARHVEQTYAAGTLYTNHTEQTKLCLLSFVAPKGGGERRPFIFRGKDGRE